MTPEELDQRRTVMRDRLTDVQRQLMQARSQVRQLEIAEQQLVGAVTVLDELLAPEATNHAEVHE